MPGVLPTIAVSDEIGLVERLQGKHHAGLKGLSKNPYIFLLVVCSTLGGFLFGYDQGVVSSILTMESFGAQFPGIYSNSSLKGWFVSTLLLAAFVGSLLNAPIADRLGRKRSMMLAVLIFTIGSAIQSSASTIAQIFIGRAITGVPIGMLTMVVPLYIAEVAPSDLRGSLVTLQQLAITVGILVSYWIDYGSNYIGGTRCAPDTPYTGGTPDAPTFDPYHDVPAGGCTGQSSASWRFPFAFQIFPAWCLAFSMVFFPYSPRWLMSKGKEQEALAVLAQLRRKPTDDILVQAEWTEIKAAAIFERRTAEEEYPGRTGILLAASQYKSLFTKKGLRRRLLVGCGIMFFQQFIGCNAMIYYLPTIFKELGLTGNTISLLGTGVYGIVNCLSTVPAVLFMDSVGRRKLLLIGAFGTFFSLVIVAGIVGGCEADWPAHKAAGNIAILFIFVYDVFFSSSWGPIGWVVPSEVFPQAIRSKAISLTTATTWISNFIIGLVTPDMIATLKWGTYAFFAAFAAIAFSFVWFLVPETRYKTLEEMDLVFKDATATQDRRRLDSIIAELNPAAAGFFANDDTKNVTEIEHRELGSRSGESFET